MHPVVLDKETERIVLAAQGNEITEHFIYRKLATSIRDPHNREILTRIADDELRHYTYWKSLTQQDVKQARWKVWAYYLISRIFGITFGIKLMERGEGDAQAVYRDIAAFVPDAERIAEDEDEHEKQLVNLIDEERLTYIGSMVLGLNDALVELTGALAGLTLALQNTRLIAMTGFITGIAASFSMAASEYLSTKSEEGPRDPVRPRFTPVPHMSSPCCSSSFPICFLRATISALASRCSTQFWSFSYSRSISPLPRTFPFGQDSSRWPQSASE